MNVPPPAAGEGVAVAAGVHELLLGRQGRPLARRDATRAGRGRHRPDLPEGGQRHPRPLPRPARVPADRNPAPDARRIPAAAPAPLRAPRLAGLGPPHRRQLLDEPHRRLPRRGRQGRRRQVGGAGRPDGGGEGRDRPADDQQGRPDEGEPAAAGADAAGQGRRLAARAAGAAQGASARLPLRLAGAAAGDGHVRRRDREGRRQDPGDEGRPVA